MMDGDPGALAFFEGIFGFADGNDTKDGDDCCGGDDCCDGANNKDVDDGAKDVDDGAKDVDGGPEAVDGMHNDMRTDGQGRTTLLPKHPGIKCIAGSLCLDNSEVTNAYLPKTR